MKNSVVLHVNSSNPNSTSPTMRIARFAAEELGIDLVCNPDTAAKYLHRKLDRVFVKYGILKFSEHREEAVKILNGAREVINLENDYLMDLDNRLRRPDRTWSTIPDGRDVYVNWNILTRQPIDTWKKKPTIPHPSRSGIIYYGAHRAGRVSDFELYFKSAPYEVTVSTFRGKKLFLETCGSKLDVVGAFINPVKPAEWQATIYIEDEQSHTLFTSLATRFYECLQIGLAQFVDSKCLGTFNKAGLAVRDEYVVASQADVKKALERSPEIAQQQLDDWWRDYGLELRQQLREAAKTL